MSQPPLTRTPAPALDLSRPGTPAAADYDDIYFSRDGGLEESRAVFLRGCGLPDGWAGRDVYTVAELGFGTGLNFLAALQLWRESRAGGRLHFVSVEAFPWEREPLARAMAAFPELAEHAGRLLDRWPGPVRGLHRVHFGEDVTLTLVHDEVLPALRALDLAADAWFLDGFSPAKNPDMWSAGVMAEMARLSAPGARLATFTAAGAVRRALSDAGFEVERVPGFGRKRHRLEARLPGEAAPRHTPPAPTVIGAGIAGASVVRAFRRRGVEPRVIRDPDHVAASGNGMALVKPRLDLNDHPASRFFLSSFLYARHAYRNAVLREGVTHIPKTESEADRLRRIAEQSPLGPGHLDWQGDRLNMPSSLVIDTEAALGDGFGDQLDDETRRVDSLSEVDGPLIVACGYGVRRLLPELGMRYARGQLTVAHGPLDVPLTYGGYALPMDAHRVLLGATHDRVEAGNDPFALRTHDDRRNMEAAAARGLAFSAPVPHRASVRVNSPDTLPRMGRMDLPDGRRAHVLSGLGSRGFVFAPLLGEALVCDYLGEPGPLDRRFARRISPAPRP